MFDLMAAAGTGLGPGRAADLRSTFSTVTAGGALVEAVELRRPDGTVIVFAHLAPWLDDRGGVIGVAFSVLEVVAPTEAGTSRPRSRSADPSDQRSLALVAGHVGVWSVDLVRGIVRGDETVVGLVGLDPDSPEYTLDEWFGMLHPDDVGSTRAAAEQAIRTRSSYEVEHRILAADGSVRWVAERGTVTLDAEGNVTGTSGFIVDITERKQVEMYRAARLSSAEEAAAKERLARNDLSS